MEGTWQAQSAALNGLRAIAEVVLSGWRCKARPGTGYSSLRVVQATEIYLRGRGEHRYAMRYLEQWFGSPPRARGTHFL